MPEENSEPFLPDCVKDLQGRALRKDNVSTLSNQASSTRFFALVPAAGTGTRLGASIPKQYLPLLGQPMLSHTLRGLASHPRMAKVYVVLKTADHHFDSMSVDGTGAFTVALRCGGDTRAQSVLNALSLMREQVDSEDWVLVHDAARPCVSHSLIDRMISALQFDAVGGIAALAVSDTLKQSDPEQRIASTVARDGLWQAQTPQMFRFGVLLRAMETTRGQPVTDESSAIESLGLKPLLVEGDPANIKVTYERDVAFAEMILKGIIR